MFEVYKGLITKSLQCQMKPTGKIGKRKGNRFYEAEMFSNHYPKLNAFLTPTVSIAAFCGGLLIKA